MNQRLTLIEDDDDDEGFEIELDWFTPKPPWYKRLWYWLTRREPPEPEEFTLTEEEEQEVEEEFNKQIAVAETIEAALASNVWVNREVEMEAPGMHRYYVVGMGVRPTDEGDFKLYVHVQMQHSHQGFFLPLHQFLAQCYPIGELTFTDYHA